MKGTKEQSNLVLKRTKRLIETTFSMLTSVVSEYTYARRLDGLRAHIESMVHNLEILGNSQTSNSRKYM